VLLPLAPAELAPLPYSTQIDLPPIVMLSGALLPVGAVAKMCWPSTTGVLPIRVLPVSATVLMSASQSHFCHLKLRRMLWRSAQKRRSYLLDAFVT
jgi:hypothetical protein